MKTRPFSKLILSTTLLCTSVVVGCAQSQDITPSQTIERARDLGIPFEGTPGPLNAITDVPGLEVGHTTLIEGEKIRTGVTAIFPLGKQDPRGVRAATTTINGTGELTGTHLIKETGIMFGPVMLTNTWSVGTVRDGYLGWVKDNMPENLWAIFSLPVVGETSDDGLNDQYGMHITRSHVENALNSAKSGPMKEGNVGGGTGMQAYGFKGGIGTASRQIELDDNNYTLGALVQANHGKKKNLRVAGVPIGQMLMDGDSVSEKQETEGKNSLIIIIATDLPFRPDQLERLSRRASLGLGRTGGIAGNVSGDFVIAFTTAGATDFENRQSLEHVSFTAFDEMDQIFQASVEAVEEALINQLVASEDMTGNDETVLSLPHDKVREIFREKIESAGSR